MLWLALIALTVAACAFYMAWHWWRTSQQLSHELRQVWRGQSKRRP